MGPEDQRQSLSEAENRESVTHLIENAQEAVGKGLLSMRGEKRDRVLGTLVPLTHNLVQCIGFMQPFIDEATALSKKCIDQLVFTNWPFKACYEQGAATYVEATA